MIVSTLYWLLGMHFFMHNPGGAGLYLPFNAWGWIFASLVMALGLLYFSQGIPIGIAMDALPTLLRHDGVSLYALTFLPLVNRVPGD